MIHLVFEGCGEITELKIDRENKKLWVLSSKTNYKETETPYKNLFDPGKETAQEKYTDTLNDKDFAKEIIAAMEQIGYGFKEVKV